MHFPYQFKYLIAVSQEVKPRSPIWYHATACLFISMLLAIRAHFVNREEDWRIPGDSAYIRIAALQRLARLLR